MGTKLKWQDVQGSIVKAVGEYTSIQEIKALKNKLEETSYDNKNERGEGISR